MDALDVLKVCVRRWWVALPVVLLAAAAGVGLVNQQKPVFYAFGSYALVFPHPDPATGTAADPRNDNPLSPGGGALLGEALMADFMSGSTQFALGGKGNHGYGPSDATNDTFFTVSVPQGAASYLVQTWGPSAQGAKAVVQGVLNAGPAKAVAIQSRAGAPPKSQFTTFITSPTQVVELPPPSAMKLLIAVTAVGVMAGAALSVVVDRLLTRRRNRPRRVSRRARRAAAKADRRAAADEDRRAAADEDRRAAADEDRRAADDVGGEGSGADPAVLQGQRQPESHDRGRLPDLELDLDEALGERSGRDGREGAPDPARTR